MSAFVIEEMTNNKCKSTQLKTCVWIVSSTDSSQLRLNRQLWTLLEAQTKYFRFHNEAQRLQDMEPAAATIIQTE